MSLVLGTFAAVADPKANPADWIGAVAASVAAVGTVITFVWQYRGLQDERAARRQEIARLASDQRAAEDAQARTVVLHDAGCGGTQWVRVRDYGVTLGNYGLYPITHIVPVLTHRETRQKVQGAGAPAPLAVLKAGTTSP
ncbi:hypothetical protein [Micromonospora chersina]|uniref:hypothetical protein n=1 Tax=Micromonospora chersina TaxID=47854 RepID=UPI0037148F52